MRAAVLLHARSFSPPLPDLLPQAHRWVVLRHRTHVSCALSARPVPLTAITWFFEGPNSGLCMAHHRRRHTLPAHPCRESARGQVRRQSATRVAGVDQPKIQRCVPRPTQTPLKCMFRLYSRLCTAVCTGGLSWDGTDEKRRSMTLFVMRYFRKPR